MRQKYIHHRRFAWLQKNHRLFLLQGRSIQFGDGEDSAAFINTKARVSLKPVGEGITLA